MIELPTSRKSIIRGRSSKLGLCMKDGIGGRFLTIASLACREHSSRYYQHTILVQAIQGSVELSQINGICNPMNSFASRTATL